MAQHDRDPARAARKRKQQPDRLPVRIAAIPPAVPAADTEEPRKTLETDREVPSQTDITPDTDADFVFNEIFSFANMILRCGRFYETGPCPPSAYINSYL